VTIQSHRGAFAALEAQPTTGVCERRPALLIPGFTGSKEDFIPVLQPLASAGRRVVAIDMRGQYQTRGAASASGYAPGELAADITAIIGAVAGDGQGLHLVGHSLGGLIAREVVLAQVARITSLTLLGSGPGRITGERADMLRGMLALMAATGREDGSGPDGRPGPGQSPGTHDSRGPSDDHLPDHRLRATVAKIWDEHLAPEARADGVPEHLIAFLHRRMMSNSPTGLVVMGKYLLACPDRTAELANLGGPPILVVYGENDDAWRPAVQERMARRLGARRVCIPGAGHSPPVEAPETTASTLTAFWRTAEDSERRQDAGPAATSGHSGQRTRPAAAPGSAASGLGSPTPGPAAPGSAEPGPGSSPAGPAAPGPASAWGLAAGASAVSVPSPSHGRRDSEAALPSGQWAR
jgi:pimeloyl-ACP methyl ester carboxylesterase